MRKKEKKIVFAFASTAVAMKMEKTMKEAGAPGRIIPVPKEITAGCGLAYIAQPEEKEQLEALMKEHEETLKNIARYEDILANYDSMAEVIVTELDAMKKEYGRKRRTQIENAEEAVFEEKQIEVIRIGLHSETTLQQNCLAGPFHPAFGELCYSRLWLQKAAKALKDQWPDGACVEISVSPKDLSKAIGQKKENLCRLAQMGYPAKVIPDPELPKGAPFRVKEVKPCI